MLYKSPFLKSAEFCMALYEMLNLIKCHRHSIQMKAIGAVLSCGATYYASLQDGSNV